MTDVSQILSQIEQGDPCAAEQLLPLVYDELRKLAATKLIQEKPGQTLQATALVHEAYLRFPGGIYTQNDFNIWRAHFGETAGSGSGAIVNATVPEPTTQTVFVVALLAMFIRQRARKS